MAAQNVTKPKNNDSDNLKSKIELILSEILSDKHHAKITIKFEKR